MRKKPRQTSLALSLVLYAGAFGCSESASRGEDTQQAGWTDGLARSEAGGGPRCGNGVREGDEACDGAELGGQTCAALGYAGGQLGCKSDCTFSTAACQASPTPDGSTPPLKDAGAPTGCTTGTWTVGDQPPTACVPYSWSATRLFSKELPNAGAGGPFNHRAANSSAMVKMVVTDNGTLGQSSWGRFGYHKEGSKHGNQIPMYYATSADPVYRVPAACKNPGGIHDPTSKVFHIPSQAFFSGLGNASDNFWLS